MASSTYRRDKILDVKNDEFERISAAGRAIITTYATNLEAAVSAAGSPVPSAGERVALKRAMARFVIDSGIASQRGWV